MDDKEIERVISRAMVEGFQAIGQSFVQSEPFQDVKSRLTFLEEAKVAKELGDARKAGYEEGTNLGAKVLKLEETLSTRMGKLEETDQSDAIWRAGIEKKTQDWSKICWTLGGIVVSLVTGIIYAWARGHIQ